MTVEEPLEMLVVGIAARIPSRTIAPGRDRTTGWVRLSTSDVTTQLQAIFPTTPCTLLPYASEQIAMRAIGLDRSRSKDGTFFPNLQNLHSTPETGLATLGAIPGVDSVNTYVRPGGASAHAPVKIRLRTSKQSWCTCGHVPFRPGGANR